MIRAVLYREAGQWTGYSAEGHSGYAEEGSDIVCAAVSVLGCTCVNSLESVCGTEVILRSNEPGSLRFDLPPMPQEKAHDAGILMAALAQGLRDVQEAYPKYIHFSIQERRK